LVGTMEKDVVIDISSPENWVHRHTLPTRHSLPHRRMANSVAGVVQSERRAHALVRASLVYDRARINLNGLLHSPPASSNALSQNP
jgi:hypothetical protein